MNELMVPGNHQLTKAQLEIMNRHIMGDNLKGQELVPLRTPFLKLKHKGPQSGKIVHSIDPAKEYTEFRAVLIKERARRAYWEGDYDKENTTPPDCRSWDGVHCATNPVDAPNQPGGANPMNPKGSLCANCPLSKWTKGEDGKDSPPKCKLVHDLILWHEDGYLAQLTHNPKSLKHINTYINQIRQVPVASYHRWSLFLVEDEDETYVIKPMFLSNEPYDKWFELWSLIEKEEEGYVDETEEVDREQASEEIVDAPTQEEAAPAETPKAKIQRNTPPATEEKSEPKKTGKKVGKKAEKVEEKSAEPETKEPEVIPQDSKEEEIAVKVTASADKVEIEQPATQEESASSVDDDEVDCPW